MAPMSWVILFITFTSMIFLSMMIIYTTMLPSPTSTQTQLKKKNMKTKW